jgi:hypothetical protein
MGSKKSTSRSSSTTNEVHKQNAQYNTLLKGADSWLSQGGFDDQYMGGADPIADMNATQTGALDASISGGQRLQDLYNTQGFASLQDSLGQYDPSKTGLAEALRAANEQSQFDFETGQMGNIRQGAQESGQGGSTRAGIAEGIARARLAQGINASNTAAYVGDAQAWNAQRQNTLNNLGAIGQGLNQGNQQQMNAGNIMQGQSQQEIEGQKAAWDYANNQAMNGILAYKQAISGDMGGTTTQKSKTTQSGGGGGLGAAIGAIGGAYLGSMAGDPMMGASIGSKVGGSL